MRFYQVITRETKTGIILKVAPENGRLPLRFTALPGKFQSYNLEFAADQLRQGIKDGLKQVGIG